MRVYFQYIAEKEQISTIEQKISSMVKKVSQEKRWDKETTERWKTKIIKDFNLKIINGTGIEEEIKAIDEELIQKVRKGVPPKALYDEIYAKAIEDSLYNSIMELNGGSKEYQKMSGVTDVKDGVIDIKKNLQEKKYSSLLTDGGRGSSKKAERIIAMNNLIKVTKDADAGKITMRKADEIINEHTGSIFNEDEKKLLKNSMREGYAKKEIKLSSLGKADDTSFEDDILTYGQTDNSTQIMNSIFNTAPKKITDFLSMGKVKERASLELLNCVEGAQRVAVRSTTPGLTSQQCVDKYIDNLKQDLNELSNAHNAITGMTGISFLIVVLEIFNRIEYNKLVEERIFNAFKLNELIAYVSGGSNVLEKHGRSEVVKASTERVTSHYVEKSATRDVLNSLHFANYIYTSEFNPLLKDNKSFSSINGASNIDDIKLHTMDALRKADSPAFSNMIKGIGDKMGKQSITNTSGIINSKKRTLENLYLELASSQEDIELREDTQKKIIKAEQEIANELKILSMQGVISKEEYFGEIKKFLQGKIVIVQTLKDDKENVEKALEQNIVNEKFDAVTKNKQQLNFLKSQISGYTVFLENERDRQVSLKNGYPSRTFGDIATMLNDDKGDEIFERYFESAEAEKNLFADLEALDNTANALSYLENGKGVGVSMQTSAIKNILLSSYLEYKSIHNSTYGHREEYEKLFNKALDANKHNVIGSLKSFVSEQKNNTKSQIVLVDSQIKKDNWSMRGKKEGELETIQKILSKLDRLEKDDRDISIMSDEERKEENKIISKGIKDMFGFSFGHESSEEQSTDAKETPLHSGIAQVKQSGGAGRTAALKGGL